MNLLIGGLRIIESAHAPQQRQIRFPKKGPYYQRRLKRSRLDRRNYSQPEFLRVGDSIVCHPSLIPLLRHAAEIQGSIDSWRL